MTFNPNATIPAKPASPVPTLGISLAGMGLPRRTVAEQAELDRHAAARALPDDLFAHHPQVVLARHEAERTRRRVEQAPQLAAARDHIADQLTDARDALTMAQRDMEDAAIADALRSDGDVSHYQAAQQQRDQLHDRVAMLETAYLAAQFTSFADQVKLKEAAKEANAALDSVLTALKRQHANAKAAGGAVPV